MYKIALIGQANVGKSTLFNALIEQKKAIVSQIPETTRDRNYGTCSWQGKTLTIIDTGGIESKKGEKDIISVEVKKHIQFALKETDLVFFMTEIRPVCRTGRPVSKSEAGPPISDFEREISRMVKQSKKPTLLVLNKADSPEKRSWAENTNWRALGFGNPFPVSAVNGSGTGDLLDSAIDKLSSSQARLPDGQARLPDGQVQPAKTAKKMKQVESARLIKVAIIGRPNVGKSTLLNALLGQEKVIVSHIPHTTRGPQDTLLKTRLSKGISYSLLLIDTAGIRKRAKIKTYIEKIGVKKSLEIIGQSDIVLFILDVEEPIGHQDKSLIRLIIKNKKGLIIVVNKCDLLSKSELENVIHSRLMQQSLPLASWAHILFLSAKKRTNVDKLFHSIYKTSQNYNRKINNKTLNQFLKKCIREKKFNPDVWKNITIYQNENPPPEFILKISKTIIRKKRIHTAQLNIIKKELRKIWDFTGVPITIKMQERKI